MAATTTPILTAQERAIIDGKKVLHGTATDEFSGFLTLFAPMGRLASP